MAGALALLERVRERTLGALSHLSRADLERKHHPLMSPLVWDLAHIGAFEDLWLCQQLGGLEPLLPPALASTYDASLTPRAAREVGQLGLLDLPETKAYLAAVRRRTQKAVAENDGRAGYLVELVVRHELQHRETMRQTMALAGLLPSGEPPPLPLPGGGAELRFLYFPAQRFRLGAPEGSFAYDNERPAHRVAVGAFAIAQRPFSNRELALFEAGGGYERRALWSAEGWAWLGHQERPRHPQAPPGGPADCLLHLSFYEAEALSRFFGWRLPTELEWELAARSGKLSGVGLAWEWTASEFGPYPGFRPYPYREYSEPFFSAGYKVLRGSSWATAKRVRSLTFRNWDLPERRQIFAGARPVKEVP